MAAEMRTFWRAFTSSGSASLTAALGGLFIGGILFLEPLFSSAWERNNEGKLFRQIELDVVERKKAQLAALQAARAAREAEKEKEKAAVAVEKEKEMGTTIAPPPQEVVLVDTPIPNEMNLSLDNNSSSTATVESSLEHRRPAPSIETAPPPQE
jgi:hypothetical protein